MVKIYTHLEQSQSKLEGYELSQLTCSVVHEGASAGDVFAEGGLLCSGSVAIVAAACASMTGRFD